MPNTEVQITEEFTEPVAEYTNYEAIPIEHKQQIRRQRHINLRSFVGDTTTFEDLARFVNMLYMDSLSMSSLADKKMNVLSVDLLARATVRQGERWTAGTCAKDPTRNNWYGLSWDVVAGSVNIAQSIILI